MIVADVRGEQQPPQEGIVTHVMKVRVENVEAWYERARAHGARVLRATHRPGVRRAGMHRRRPGRPPLAVHRDDARRGARGIRLPDCRALARTVTKSRTPNICRPTPAGRPAPGCLLSSSECTGGTQPPGGTGKRLACQEMTRPVRYCCLLPTGSLARLRIAADRPGHGAKVVHESGYAPIVVMDSLVCPQASAQIQAVWISCRMSGCSRCLCSRGMSRIGPWVPGPATAAPPWPATALLPVRGRIMLVRTRCARQPCASLATTGTRPIADGRSR